MSAAGQQLRLIVERLNSEPRWASVQSIELNDVTRVAIGAQDTNNDERVVVQPLPGHTLRLAMWSGHRRAIVNGQAAPMLAIVASGDEIELDGLDDVRMHVAVYQPSAVTIAGDELVGHECGVCLSKFAAGAKVYRCACGAAFHAEAEMNCAGALGQCPACERAISDGAEGYVIAPEGYHGE